MKLRSLKFIALAVLITCAVPVTGHGGTEKNLQYGSDKLKALLTSFEDYAKRVRKSWGVPGMAVAIVPKDEIVFAKAFGVKEVGGADPVDVHTIFQIGSASKAFTSSLVSMMVDEGKFKWTDRVMDHLPEFVMHDPWVTKEFLVEDLMAQHSGLPPYAGDLQSMVGFSREHIIHSLRYQKPVSSFRSQFAYVNNLFLVAAALVEKHTAKSWEDNLHERIFEPLGMFESTAGLKAFQEAANLAIPHARTENMIKPLYKDWPFHQWVYVYGPAGGINSNILNMAKWVKFHMGKGSFEGKRLISTANMNFLHTPKTVVVAGEQAKSVAREQPLIGEGAFYAQGWMHIYGNPYQIIWHNGGTTGSKSVVAFAPRPEVGIVVLSNLGDTMVPEILAQWFLDRYFGLREKDWNQVVLEAKGNKKEAPIKVKPPDVKSSARPSTSYTGTYANPVYGDVTISTGEKSLVLTIGPNKVKMHLESLEMDTFRLIMPEMPGDLGSAHFKFKPSGEAETLILEAINSSGEGTFEKVTNK